MEASRHCERSEAIHTSEESMDCSVASLVAMTEEVKQRVLMPISA